MLIAALSLMGAAQGAFAHDHFGVWPGNWDRNAPGTTTQAWEFGGQQGPPTYNPYGTAQLVINGGILTPGGLVIGGTGGSVNLHIPNNPVSNPYKLMFIQLTSSKALVIPPDVSAPGAITTNPGPTTYDEGGGLHSYSWITKIEPNPSSENVIMTFYPDTVVEEIVIDTICTIPEPVPEPSSLAALGMSGIFTGLLALRRRRR